VENKNLRRRVNIVLEETIMKKLIIALVVSLFTFNVQAQEPPTQKNQLLLNITIPCREDGIKFISELVNLYGEQEFASGTFQFKPLVSPSMIKSDLLIYVAPNKSTFSIFSLHKVGKYDVACVIAGGTDLKPFDGKYRK